MSSTKCKVPINPTKWKKQTRYRSQYRLEDSGDRQRRSFIFFMLSCSNNAISQTTEGKLDRNVRKADEKDFLCISSAWEFGRKIEGNESHVQRYFDLFPIMYSLDVFS